MADRGTNIDLIFRNGLKDLEVMPPCEAWEKISPAIKRSGRARVSLRAAAVLAAILAVGAVPYMISLLMSDDFATPAITLNGNILPEGSYAGFTVPVNDPDAIAPVTVADNTILYAQAENVTPADFSAAFSSPSFRFTNNLRTNLVNTSPRQAPDMRLDVRAPEITEITMPIMNEEVISNEMRKRISIGAMMVPSYYSSFYAGPDDAGRELVSSESGIVSYSGGLTVAFDVNKRLSVQTGLYYSSIGQRIDDVSSYSGFGEYSSSKGGTLFTIITSNGTINSGNRDLYLADNNSGTRVMSLYTADVFDPAKSGLPYLSNTLNQEFNYLEIPLVLRYKLIDRRVDFRVIGGLSYNMLVGNTAYVSNDGEKFYLGDTEGLSPITFSSSLGMGMEYSLSDSFSFSFEPTFRYYITPLGGLAGSSIHPYSFGLLSGLIYKF